MSSPATFDQPAGWTERATMLDDSLPHQIRLLAPTGREQHLMVSCTCRRGKEEIAVIATCEQAWTAYNGYHAELLGPNDDDLIDTHSET